MMNSGGSSTPPTSEEDMDLRRGPWTVEEDLLLINYISTHGEGRWNSLARCAGLKRTGKSCRLRWLNYLRPDVRRGNITPEEQLLILELHSRWGNRWSKIAQHLPGRTDNEIKNYWRTRVQKHAKQLKCEVNSKQFKDVMRYLWMPRLLERIQASNSGSAGLHAQFGSDHTASAGSECGQLKLSPENSCGPVSSFESSSGTYLSSPVTVACGEDKSGDPMQISQFNDCWLPEQMQSPCCYPNLGLPDFDWFTHADLSENLWGLEDNWAIQQQQL